MNCVKIAIRKNRRKWLRVSEEKEDIENKVEEKKNINEVDI